MYDFMTLSAEDFERLIGDLLSAEWGVHLESFKSGADGGVDLRHISTSLSNKWTIVQCKRYSANQFNKLLTHLRNDEHPKLSRLKPQRYVIATSVPLSPHNKDQLFDVLKPYCQTPVDILGVNELNGLLRNHPRVERSHFKLWISSTGVLDRVLHSRVFNLTEDTVDILKQEISRLVEHSGFTEALQRYDQEVCK